MDINRERFVTLCEDAEIAPDSRYSGRGMFGKQCIAIYVPDGRKLVQFLFQIVPQIDPKCEWMEETDELDYSPEWGNLKQDDMGRDIVYFWPDIKAVDESE